MPARRPAQEHEPTPEQVAAFAAGDHIVLQAGAGSGKTTTLAMLAAGTRRWGRCLAFNISGSEDHLMPPSVQRSNAKHYKSNTVTEVKEYEGMAHLLPAQKGWEEVADYALAWAVEHAGWPTAQGRGT